MSKRRSIARQYTERLTTMGIVTPMEALDARHVYHLYTVRFSKRHQIQSSLKEAGVASDVYYPQPPHLSDPCRQLGYGPGDFPVAEQASRETLCLPLYPEMTFDQIYIVLDSVQKILEREVV